MENVKANKEKELDYWKSQIRQSKRQINFYGDKIDDTDRRSERKEYESFIKNEKENIEEYKREYNKAFFEQLEYTTPDEIVDKYKGLMEECNSLKNKKNELEKIKEEAIAHDFYELSMDIRGYQVEIDESIRNLENDIYLIEEYSIPLPELGKRLKYEKNIELQEKDENSERENEKEPKTDLENYSVEELQKIIASNSKIIDNNKDTIKKELISKIIEQQKEIEGQQKEINNYKIKTNEL